jgi:hypothetical protein
LVAGSQNGQSWGDATGNVKNGYIYGTTLIDADDLATGSHSVRMFASTNPGDGIVLEKSIVCTIIESAGRVYAENTLVLDDASDPTAVFPDIADLATATNRPEIELALTTAGEGLNLGAVATANAVDWVTIDPTAIILWENIPSGIAWDDVTQATISTVYEFPVRRIMNRRSEQTVVPGSGVEWRSLDTDGSTVVQDWTSSSGTIEPDQYIQKRVTTASTAITDVTAVVTINGFDVSSVVTTEITLQDSFRMNGACFFDPSNLPASTSVLEFEAAIKFNSVPAAAGYIFALEASGRLEVTTVEQLRVAAIRDSAATIIFSLGTASVTPEWPAILNFKIDLPNNLATFSYNDVVVDEFVLSANTGLLPSNREIAFGCIGNAATSKLANDTDVEYFKVWRTTSGTRTLHKEISVAALGSIAAINADPWISGTVVASPDDTAPVLSGFHGTVVSATEIEFDFSTNEGNGDAYWYVSTSATPPSESDLIAGTGSVDFGSFAVASLGAQAAISVSGLTSGTTYYIYVIQDDDAANRSNMLTGSVTPAATNNDITDIILSRTTVPNDEATSGAVVGTLSVTRG